VSAGPDPVLDTAALDRLRDSLGDELLADLVSTFLDDAPVQLAALRDALARGDAEAARRTAHTLKSNGATFGAEGFAETCRRLEEMGKEGALADAERLLPQAELEYSAVGEALAPLRGPGGAP
jgi:HPt (histidine-containing phosphotransfer) domain-containing protein